MVHVIRLSRRNGETKVNVNVEHISYIEDLRTDKVVADNKTWHYTLVCLSNGKTLEVRETEDEIMNLIKNQYILYKA